MHYIQNNTCKVRRGDVKAQFARRNPSFYFADGATCMLYVWLRLGLGRAILVLRANAALQRSYSWLSASARRKTESSPLLVKSKGLLDS